MDWEKHERQQGATQTGAAATHRKNRFWARKCARRWQIQRMRTGIGEPDDETNTLAECRVQIQPKPRVHGCGPRRVHFMRYMNCTPQRTDYQRFDAALNA